MLDAVSIAPVLKDPGQQVREFSYADVFRQSRIGFRSHRAIRNDRYKLIHNLIDSSDEFYDLQNDLCEENNLLDAELAPVADSNYQELKQRLAELVSEKSRFKTN